MINELYKMYKGLEKVDLLPLEKHNDIQFPGMGTTFRVLLGKDGEVKEFGLMTREQIKNCWSVGDGNKNQFPAIKLTFPLLPEGNKAYKEWKENHKKPSQEDFESFISGQIELHTSKYTSIADRIELHALNLSSISEWPSYRKKIIEKMQLFKSVTSNEKFFKLFERFVLSPRNGVQILDEVFAIIQNSLKGRSIDELVEIANLLFGTELDAKGAVKGGKRTTLLIDTFPLDDVDRYATSLKEVPSLSRALFSFENVMENKHKTVCALTGNLSTPVTKKFPSEKLSVIGSTIIFAKSDTSGPTVQRYGRWKTDAYIVDKALINKLAASISFLASEKQKNITWKKIPSSTGSSPNLLLAYCVDDLSIPIGDLISPDPEMVDMDDYKDATETVLNLYSGSNLKPDSVVEVSEFIALDKANRKISFSFATDLQELMFAAEDWNRACKNSPDFKLLAAVRKDTKLLAPWSIEPVKFNFLSKLKYIRDGSESLSVPGMKFSETMKLFFSLNLDEQKTAEHWLIRFTDQYEPLFNLCSQTKSYYLATGTQRRQRASPKLNTQALIATTLLSILLYKLNRTREVYMNDFAYQLGQLCSALDELHIAFCHAERSGDVPNTTIGNMLYGMALQNPLKALSVLASRIKPYEAWAKRSKNLVTDDKAIKAGLYANSWINKVSSNLHLLIQEHPIEITDTYKTELMLGYLAGRPFEGKNVFINDFQKESEGDKQ